MNNQCSHRATKDIWITIFTRVNTNDDAEEYIYFHSKYYCILHVTLPNQVVPTFISQKIQLFRSHHFSMDGGLKNLVLQFSCR